VGDEADAAGVVLVRRVVQALRASLPQRQVFKCLGGQWIHVVVSRLRRGGDEDTALQQIIQAVLKGVRLN
jgi:hypothetical protein